MADNENQNTEPMTREETEEAFATGSAELSRAASHMASAIAKVSREGSKGSGVSPLLLEECAKRVGRAMDRYFDVVHPEVAEAIFRQMPSQQHPIIIGLQQFSAILVTEAGRRELEDKHEDSSAEQRLLAATRRLLYTNVPEVSAAAAGVSEDDWS